MDPNANLAEQRMILMRINQGYMRLAELTQALDVWITSGGFLPDAWTGGASMENVKNSDTEREGDTEFSEGRRRFEHWRQQK